MATFAIYNKTPGGWYRMGTIRGDSAYHAAQRFWKNSPNAIRNPELWQIARRVKCMGRWVDSTLCPMDMPEEE